jgi:protein-disulfide isomerase
VSRIVLLGALLISLVQTSAAQTSEDLRKELEAIREGQKAIQRELAEIKKLLAGQQRVAEALPKTIDIANEPTRGSGTAQVALIEYSDYQCPFCGRYVTDTFPKIEQEYIRTGKIRYVFRDLPLTIHQQAFKAAEATHCAGEQGKFWEMHDRLFQNQKALGASDLSQHAQALGLNGERFQQCLESGRFAAAIQKDVSQANDAGISGTPTFLLGLVQPNSSTVKIVKKIVGAKSYPDFKTSIDSLLSAPAADTR